MAKGIDVPHFKYISPTVLALKYLVLRKRMRKPYASCNDMKNFSPYFPDHRHLKKTMEKFLKDGWVTKKGDAYAITATGERIPFIVAQRHRERCERRGIPMTVND